MNGEGGAMNVDELQVGRELDALVWERVFDGVVARSISDIPDGYLLAEGLNFPCYADGTAYYKVPNFSTDIAAAWRVWEKLKSLSNGQYDDLWQEFLKYLSFAAHTEFRDLALTTCSDITWILSPLVICRATLKAVSK